MSELRPYQSAAVESALHALATAGSAIMQMPTGAGKTKAATAIVKAATGPIWFVCHRREIIRQAARAFAEAGIEFSIVSPDHPFQPDIAVQIVSVQTLVKRVADLPAPLLVIWDECHHVAAKSWAAIRNALTGAKHLGLTATPERLDGKGLAEWFAVLIKGPTVRALIDDGYLVPFRYFAPSEPDLTSAKLQAGDYRKVDVEAAMNIPVLIGDALDEYKKNLDGKRALVFASSVDASRALAERFNAEGVPAMHVDGTTPTDVRDAAVERLASGDIKVLTNVEVFTEGVDIPAIDAVILLRPTKSPALFLQMVGRALRPAPGKTEAVIFDHAGLWLDHDLPSADFMWSLEGDAQKERLAASRANGGRKRRCPECKEVRVERVEMCSCGYEFPTGREIGEYDGQLWELRGDVPEGCVTKTAFARLLGCTSKVVFSAEKIGLPTEAGGYINVARGMQWFNDNWHPHTQPPKDVTDQHEYCPKFKFLEMMGLSSGANTSTFESLDLKKAKNGWIHIESATNLVREHWPFEKIIPYWLSDSEYELVKTCADRLGSTSSTIYKWIREKGFPIERHGKVTVVRIESADEWLKTYQTRHFLSASERIGFEPINTFANRLGVDWGTISRMLPMGMPKHHKTNWVHIQQGLEWVRDNTKIQIPPEAWPSANDNGAQHHAAA